MRRYKVVECECEKPGPFSWILPGILVGQPQKKGHRYIERCDLCERFSSDEAACEVYSKCMAGKVGYDRKRLVIFLPA